MSNTKAKNKSLIVFYNPQLAYANFFVQTYKLLIKLLLFPKICIIMWTYDEVSLC